MYTDALARLCRNLLTGFVGARALVAAEIDGDHGVEILGSGPHVIVAEARCFNGLCGDLHGLGVAFATVNIVSGEIGLGVRRPGEIDESLLSDSAETGMHVDRLRSREYVCGFNV